MNEELTNAPCATRAFTLIELLVVLSVIAVLAALTFPAVQGAKRSMIRARARSQLVALQTAIGNYKDKLGHYPPDDRIDANPEPYALNQLYYELLGTTNSSGTFETLDGSARLAAADVPAVFGGNITGFMNCAQGGDEARGGVPFIRGLKPSQYMRLTNAASTVVYVLGDSVEGPPVFQTSVKFTPWRYNASSPHYNTRTFDLWIDVMVGDKTNRICNWTDKPLYVSTPYR